MKTIDLTPTWAGVMPLLMAVLESGSEEGKREAREELMRLAKAMDEVNEERKEANRWRTRQMSL